MPRPRPRDWRAEWPRSIKFKVDRFTPAQTCELLDVLAFNGPTTKDLRRRGWQHTDRPPESSDRYAASETLRACAACANSWQDLQRDAVARPTAAQQKAAVRKVALAVSALRSALDALDDASRDRIGLRSAAQRQVANLVPGSASAAERDLRRALDTFDAFIAEDRITAPPRQPGKQQQRAKWPGRVAWIHFALSMFGFAALLRAGQQGRPSERVGQVDFVDVGPRPSAARRRKLVRILGEIARVPLPEDDRALDRLLAKPLRTSFD